MWRDGGGARWLLALTVSVCWPCDRRPRIARDKQISGIKQPEVTVVQEKGEVTRVSRGISRASRAIR
jgi:hypothetical protein